MSKHAQFAYLTRRWQLPSWLLTSAVLLGLLAYSLVVGVLAGNGRNLLTMLMLALPAGILGLIFAAKYFEFAVLMIPIAALTVPLELPTGTSSYLPISLLLVLMLTTLWCASMVLRGWKIAASPLNRPMLLFGVICVISLFWSLIWRDPILVDWNDHAIVVQVASLVTFLMSFGAVLLIGNFVTTPGQLKFVFGAFLFLGTLMLIGRLTGISELPALRIWYGSKTVFLLNDGGLWGMWLVGPAYGLLIAQPGLRMRWRVLLVLLIALALYQSMVLAVEWLSGWVPTIVAIYAITFLRSRKACLVLLIIGVIAAYTYRDYFNQVAEDNIADGSLQRLSLWEQNWRIVRAHWLFGTGPAGYASYYATYYPNEARSTHNNYVDIVAQFGFTGMLVWLWLSVVSVWEGWTLVQRAPPGFLRTMAIVATGGWVGAMASMFFGDWVLPFAYNQTISGYKYTVYSWIFLGTLISIRRLLPAPARMRR